MFRRFASKFNNQFALFANNKQRSTLILKAIQPKRSLLAFPTLALTSFCALGYFYQTQTVYNAAAEPSQGLDSLEQIQEKASEFGSLEEEKKTIEYLKRHLEAYTKLKGDKSDEVAVILMLLASHCIASGEDKLEGIKYGERSCDIFLELEEDKHMFLDQLDDLAGMALQVSTEEAIRLTQKALEYKQKLKGEKYPGVIISHLALGELYMIKDDKDKANQHLDQAKNLLNSLGQPTEDPDNVNFEACEKFHSASRYDESNAYCNKAINYLKTTKAKKNGDNTLKEGRAIDILAQNALALGNAEQSVEHLLILNDFLEKNLTEKNDPYFYSKGQNFVKVGNIYFDKEDYEKALQNFRQALDQFQHVKQEGGQVLVYITKRTMADVFAAQREFQKAHDILKEAYQVAKATFGESHPNTKNDELLLKDLESRGYK